MGILKKLFKRKKSRSTGTAGMLFTISILLFLAWIFFGSKLPFAKSQPLEDLRQQIINSPPAVKIAKRVNPQHQKIIEELDNVGNNTQPTQTFADLESQLETLAGKGKLFTAEATKVFDEVVKPSDEDSNMADRAIKYGQYVYCKQIVDEWDKN